MVLDSVDLIWLSRDGHAMENMSACWLCLCKEHAVCEKSTLCLLRVMVIVRDAACLAVMKATLDHMINH